VGEEARAALRELRLRDVLDDAHGELLVLVVEQAGLRQQPALLTRGTQHGAGEQRRPLLARQQPLLGKSSRTTGEPSSSVTTKRPASSPGLADSTSATDSAPRRLRRRRSRRRPAVGGHDRHRLGQAIEDALDAPARAPQVGDELAAGEAAGGPLPERLEVDEVVRRRSAAPGLRPSRRSRSGAHRRAGGS
jgi:hypothetical protein